MKNKKGLMIELLLLIVVGIVIVAFFVMWKYGFGLVNTQLLNVPSDSGSPNVTEAVTNTFSYVNTGLDGLKTIALMFFFAYIIATFIIAYFSKEHPILLFVYFLITLVFVIFSIYVANAYEDLQNDATLGAYFQEFTVTNYILLKLPYFVAVVGFFGIIIQLSRIIKEKDFET